jgi:dihydrolipoamide dehydrogenase
VPDEYDVVVIGAGPTGENVADRAVKAGLTAVIAESELVGGECSYWACMPSKALLRPVAAVAEAGHLEGVRGARLDPPGVLDRRDSFASRWKDDGQVKWLNSAHVELVRGNGRLTGPKTVSVSQPAGPAVELRARHAVVIATGTSATIPPIPGLAEARPWTSREATSAHEVPKRLAILGGGVVGSEMACAWQALGGGPEHPGSGLRPRRRGGRQAVRGFLHRDGADGGRRRPADHHRGDAGRRGRR